MVVVALLLWSDYRAAQGISIAHERERATTEDLRRAMVHYRSLFDELLESRRPAGVENPR